MDIFKTAVWYFAYKEGKKSLEQEQKEENIQEENDLVDHILE